MITSFEVGAVFKILDEASPALRKILAQVRALNKAVEETRASLSAMLKSLDVALDPAIAETRALAAEWKAVSVAAQGAGRSIASAARASAVPGIVPRIAAGRGGRGGGGLHFNSAGVPVPGGHLSYQGGRNAAMAGVGMAGYGAFLAAQQQDAVWQMIFHSGMADTEQNREMFDKIIKDAHSLTGAPLDDIRAAAIDEIRMFRGTPGGGVDVLPEMIRAAATEARAKGKGTTVDTAMESLIGLAHMRAEYGPKAIKELAPVFAFLSSSTAATLPQIERAAGYAVPILRAGMEIDSMQTMLMGIVLQRAGITNTKSGTWIRNMALNSLPGTSLMSRVAFKKHEEALKALGLIDNKNNPTWFTGGKPDLIKMLTTAGDHAQSIPLIKRAAYEKQLFGAQGFGAFAILSDPKVMGQMKALIADMPQFKQRYGTFYEDYNSQSTAQAARKGFADFQNVLMDIGGKVLPPVNSALQDFDALLKSLQGILPKGSSSKDSAWGKVGAAALEGFGLGALGGSLVPGVGTLAGGVVTGAVSGGLKLGEIWLGLDNDAEQVKKFGGAANQTGEAAQSATSALSGFANILRGLGAAMGMGIPNSGASPQLQHYVPTAPAHGGAPTHVTMTLDRDVVGKFSMRYIAQRAMRPLEGSAYHDNTWNSPASDQVLSMG
jgi:hypothetical protein